MSECENKTPHDNNNIPFCTCGKCVIKRGRKDHYLSLPYSSKLASIYQNDMNWKTPRQFGCEYLKAKHSAMENCVRKNISGSMNSSNNIAYKPFKVCSEEVMSKKKDVKSIPFYGGTTYENNFINYGSSRVSKGIASDPTEFKINFRGKSNYSIDYRLHDGDDYLKRDEKITHKPTLRFVGKVPADTEHRDNYLPIDYNQPCYFGGEKQTKGNKHQMIPCPFPKSNFESITHTSYVDHFRIPCPLKKHMIKNDITSLII
jgi:hypothetical protein